MSVSFAHTTDKQSAQQSQQRGGSHPPWSQDPSSWLLWMPKCTFHVYDSNSRNQDCKPWMNSWYITKARSNIQGYSLISPKSQHIMTTWYLNIYFQSTEFMCSRYTLLFSVVISLYSLFTPSHCSHGSERAKVLEIIWLVRAIVLREIISLVSLRKGGFFTNSGLVYSGRVGSHPPWSIISIIS